jgi:hypothetical protein
VMDGNMNRALQGATGAEPTEGELAEAEWLAAQAARVAAERRDARLDAALLAGWSIQRDPVRLEYTAAREMVTARTMDELLDAIEEAREGGPA